MKSILGFAMLLPVLLGSVSPASAAITIYTDKAEYALDETVFISVHNDGPDDTAFSSWPFVYITEVNSGECYYGCAGLPVVTEFPASTTANDSWDVGASGAPPGTYRIEVNVLGTTVSTTVRVYEVLPTDSPAWSTIKAQYVGR